MLRAKDFFAGRANCFMSFICLVIRVPEEVSKAFEVIVPQSTIYYFRLPREIKVVFMHENKWYREVSFFVVTQPIWFHQSSLL